MDEPVIFEKLQSIATQLSIEIRYVDIDNPGGLCRIGESLVILANQKLSIDQTQVLIAKALSRCSTDQVFMPPKIREYINQHSI